MNEYFLTFGQQYSRIQHPRFPTAHPDGWVTIEAVDMDMARAVAFRCFDKYWSDLYDADTFQPEFYRRGQLLRLLADEVLAKSAPTDPVRP